MLPALLLLQFFQVGLSEEIGWRRYALPHLQSRLSALNASLILGVVWALWHIGSFLVPGTYHHTLPLGWYVLDCVATTIIMTWLYNSTKGSLIAVVLFHVAIDATAGYLPYFFQSGGLYPAVISNSLFAVIVLTIYGARHLSRQPRTTAKMIFGAGAEDVQEAAASAVL